MRNEFASLTISVKTWDRIHYAACETVYVYENVVKHNEERVIKQLDEKV